MLFLIFISSVIIFGIGLAIYLKLGSWAKKRAHLKIIKVKYHKAQFWVSSLMVVIHLGLILVSALLMHSRFGVVINIVLMMAFFTMMLYSDLLESQARRCLKTT